MVLKGNKKISLTEREYDTAKNILKDFPNKDLENGTLFGFSVSTEIKVLMGIPASDIWSSERASLIFKLRNRTKYLI